VKDGDTLEVMKEGVAVRVRLYGIDCPEKGQAFGERAKKFASDLAFGKTVKVIEKDREKDWGSNLYPLLFKTIVKKAGGKLSQE